MNTQCKVAVLGAGIMGAAMARNLLRAGHEVQVWNRDHAKTGPLADAGARVASSPAEAVAGVDVVVTMLYDAAAVTEVMRQAAPGIRPGTAWVQSTTVGVNDAAALAELADQVGVDLVEAPVSGTREPAEAGQLLVIAAGPEAVRERVAPVLDAIGARTVWTGQDPAEGSATRLKLVVNSWVIAASNAAGEILALAEALGVDPQQFFNLIDGGGLDLPFLRTKAALILEDRLEPASFAVDTSLKDAHLILDTAREYGLRLDGAEASAARLGRVASQGRSKQDMAAAYYASTP
ncbi:MULTISPECIES: NAD(P)-dependent oxidoreductase [unclassified Arthrobacter]|uniref:NAD(P)-dependent oxidoreductase n=1 Tax=unclassified Arthrobacter TaxID=235627 RepID=UPI002E04820B|nr:MULTISPECIES: NAD(P)-dependent oxidoreductase [unclassified Arthrobacter]MEC5193426.1 3-hydroxyisobutyrate dehydrogenase [Arthrobacter sp. MP_M4]MEC5204902.1 3-hydroxyisobutyrate dehydrogenase [Arthrobacter sp. MP_M7]